MDKLRAIAGAVPDGAVVRRIDALLFARLPEELGNECFFENFVSREDFLQRGIGFCAMLGEEIVSAATSMAAARGMIDIEIETAGQHQRQGYGTLVGACLTLHCLEHGIEPVWVSANAESSALAEKLGYQRVSAYETLAIGV